MIHELINWVGFYQDASFPGASEFWSAPIGLFITGSMCICSAINIVHPGIDDNLFDRIWYSIFSLVMLCAFILGINPDTNPRHVIQSTMYLLCIRCIVSVVQRHRQYKKTGKIQKTLGM